MLAKAQKGLCNHLDPQDRQLFIFKNIISLLELSKSGQNYQLWREPSEKTTPLVMKRMSKNHIETYAISSNGQQIVPTRRKPDL